jgi:hypothetical protein
MYKLYLYLVVGNRSFGEIQSMRYFGDVNRVQIANTLSKGDKYQFITIISIQEDLTMIECKLYILLYWFVKQSKIPFGYGLSYYKLQIFRFEIV